MTLFSTPFRYCLLACASLAAQVGFGHGVQLQLTYDTTTQKIVSREIVSTDTRPTTLGAVTRIYVMPLLLADGTTPAAHPAAQAAWYSKPDITNYPSGNGIAYQWDTAAPAGGQIAGTGWAWKDSSSLPNLAGTAFTYQFTDRLLKWDGSAFTAAAAGSTQLQAFRGDATSAPTITTTTGSGTTLVYGNVSTSTQSTNPHSNAGFRLLGNGTSFDPAFAGEGTDGIYLQTLQITSSATGVLASDPLSMLLYKNTSFAEAYAVAESFAASQGIPATQIQAVPEPGTISLLAVTGLAGGYGLWRRARRRAAGTGEG
jgi:hypothetical protein